MASDTLILSCLDYAAIFTPATLICKVVRRSLGQVAANPRETRRWEMGALQRAPRRQVSLLMIGFQAASFYFLNCILSLH